MNILQKLIEINKANTTQKKEKPRPVSVPKYKSKAKIHSFLTMARTSITPKSKKQNYLSQTQTISRQDHSVSKRSKTDPPTQRSLSALSRQLNNSHLLPNTQGLGVFKDNNM